MFNQTRSGTKSVAQTIFEIVETNPGLSTKDIYQSLAPTLDFASVKRSLEYLRDRRHQIENRGDQGGPGSITAWYVVERNDPYYELADHTLDAMRGMTLGVKRAYLAELFEELANR